jgi:hypothetical protein
MTILLDDTPLPKKLNQPQWLDFQNIIGVSHNVMGGKEEITSKTKREKRENKNILESARARRGRKRRKVTRVGR